MKTYKAGEPIFFSDLNFNSLTKQALNQQMKMLCNEGKLEKFDTGVYYIPKKGLLNSEIGPSAREVARYKYISKGEEVNGYYTGNVFANQIGISTQVPQVVEIVTNNTNSSQHEVIIGNQRFYIRPSIVEINTDNVYVLQMLDLLKNLDIYLDGTYENAKDCFLKYIKNNNITREDVDKYIRNYPISVFKYYYELELDHILPYKK